MAQAFWASTGFELLGHEREGLVATDAWLAGFLERSELKPPADAGAHELGVDASVAATRRASVAPAMRAAVEDGDARQNWREFLRFRDRVVAAPTLEEVYRGLFAADAVDLSPTFVDALAQAITRDVLDGTEDPWLCRAGEMLFRRQRVSTEGGQVLAADAMTLEAFAETGGGRGLAPVLLFRLEFRDPRDAAAEMGARPVYLGLACRPDRTLKLKPQNLLLNLPLRNSGEAQRG